jgi:phenylalanyl-tRNA synthetase alpha chain
VSIIKELIYNYFHSEKFEDRNFKIYENFNPIVTTNANFDSLLIPLDHPARSKSDTYYFDEEFVLRTHTSAHQNEILKSGTSAFLVTGDVYRKDEIDSTHYPVFHQMEGLFVDIDDKMTLDELKEDLIETLKGICKCLFPNCSTRVKSDYFPFTDPSFEIEVCHKEKWIEILGCGIVQSKIIQNCAEFNKSLIRSDGSLKNAWAFGLGLDRLAMILFEIPDIRLLWVENEKFLNQFKEGTITKFKPYSTLDTITKDISFYIIDDSQVKINHDISTNTTTGTWDNENDMYDVIREFSNKYCPDIVAKVEKFDTFYNSKLEKLSHTYRIYYSPTDPNMNNPSAFTTLVNKLQLDMVNEIKLKLSVKIR